MSPSRHDLTGREHRRPAAPRTGRDRTHRSVRTDRSVRTARTDRPHRSGGQPR
ncbi:hypothetical protein ACIA8O_05420 [Kitasatospora sp. NPDC051853]|uniref:hypothetical protein n=1 Tax=Kitasatospora sp. NPDC051853 TaxID=3364058 RepID=UPI003793093D